MAAELKGFVLINRDEVAACGRQLGFDLYTVSLDDVGADPHPFCRKGQAMDSVLAAMDERLLAKFYIRRQALQSYYADMEASLSGLLEDPQVSVGQKSQVLHRCANNVLKDVYDDPRSGENLARTKDITENIIKFTMGSEGSVPGLLRLSSHDYYTFTHCVNVSVFGVGLMERIDSLSRDDLYDFALGCILHDVGKTEVADAILNKPGRLTDEEFEVIKSHPMEGYALMEDKLPPIALDVILHHHEKFDGSGYPHGLDEKNISDYSRVAAIADVYDALTTNRPYADARDPFKALTLMKQKMVGHFEQQKFMSFVEFLSTS